MNTEIGKEYDELLDVIDREKSRSKNKEVKNENIEKSSSSEKAKEDTSNKTEEILRTIEKQNKTDKSKNKGTGFDVKKFENLMKTKLIDEHKRLQSYDKPYIWVSELTYCLRKNYYYRKKYPIDLKKVYSFPYLYLINKIGKSVHDVIQELYDFSEVEKTVLSEKYNVKGRVDAIRENYLYEFKTTDPGRIRNLAANYNQGLIYSYILNNEYDYTINTITLVYVERSFKKIIVYDYLIDNDKAEELLNNALILKKALNDSKVPEPIMADSEQCKFCGYKNYCKEDKSEIIKPFEDSESKEELEIEKDSITKTDENKNKEEEKEDNQTDVKRKAKFLLGG